MSDSVSDERQQRVVSRPRFLPAERLVRASKQPLLRCIRTGAIGHNRSCEPRAESSRNQSFKSISHWPTTPKTGHWHRRLSTYIDGLTQAGCDVDRRLVNY